MPGKVEVGTDMAAAGQLTDMEPPRLRSDRGDAAGRILGKPGESRMKGDADIEKLGRVAHGFSLLQVQTRITAVSIRLITTTERPATRDRG
jgi:hypothetical protein